MSEIGGAASERLKALIDRIERLEEEKKALTEDIKEVYAEAKSAGFDVKIIRQLIRLRKMDPADRNEMEEILTIYMRAVGM